MELARCIIRALKKGSIKHVLLFADTAAPPEPPYVVVKPENGSIPGTRQYRIIVHCLEGRADELEQYAMTELDRLLPGWVQDKEHRYRLYKGGYTDLMAEVKDRTIVMERIFYTPLPGYQ